MQLILVNRAETISGGNFHGEYPAKVYNNKSLTITLTHSHMQALDYLAICIHEIANMSERRLERMIHPGQCNSIYLSL